MKKIFLALFCLPLLGGALYGFFQGDEDYPPYPQGYYAEEAEDDAAWDGFEYTALPDPPETPGQPEQEESTAPSLEQRAPAYADSGPVVEIRDKFFIQQCNDIYLNPTEYVGRTVRLEGIYDEFKDEQSGRTERYVIRYGPGCCGNDGVAGFEFFYDGDTAPKQDDWVEVTGTVDMKKGDDGEEYLVLAPSELKVMAKRGQEFVEN
ncbi:MAG: hypothetical protein LBL73_12535 [Synergistaceae bacterium]|jgi:uncharacterized membrane protein YcgQ (UPF0703/DUF1980 family)|nr:hypothetical protein [Synergistaceae bacterium]